MPCVYLPGPAPAVTVANNWYSKAGFRTINIWRAKSQLAHFGGGSRVHLQRMRGERASISDTELDFR